jgi:hypothetical protein
MHLDSTQVAFLQRELEELDKQAYEALVPGNLARKYIPDQQGVAEWQESYRYKMYTKRGKTKLGGKNGDRLPRASLTMVSVIRRIEQFPLSYGWTVREIQQAAATGTPLDNLTVMAARTAANRKVDDFLAFGNGTDIDGLLTNSSGDVAILTPNTKTGGGPWLTAGNLPDEVLGDINKITEELTTGLKQTDSPGFDKFVLLVPTKQYAYIASTPRSTFSDTTILKFAIQNNPWIESIEPWWQCNTAGAGGSVDRLVAYPRTPLAVAPQERDLEILVPVSVSCGGTILRYPVAMRYMDNM